jgi:hypothetical protein
VALYVSVNFVFDSVKAGGNDSVIMVLSFEASMNKSDNNTEQPSNDNSQKPSIHIITGLAGTGCLL